MKPGRLWCFLNVYFDLNYRYLHRVILLCLLSSVKPGWFVLREARHTKSFKESCGLFSNPPRPFCSNLNEGVRLKEINKKKKTMERMWGVSVWLHPDWHSKQQTTFQACTLKQEGIYSPSALWEFRRVYEDLVKGYASRTWWFLPDLKCTLPPIRPTSLAWPQSHNQVKYGKTICMQE